ncbi:MAG: ribonuclease HII [Alphaproteobacteria bacterium]|nr:ribonuclease HII [Alphaproteobacteria bacterium]
MAQKALALWFGEDWLLTLDYRIESGFGRRVCGVDEAGRGPLAGPVVAAAVILDPDRMPSRLLAMIDDSKKLSPQRRHEVSVELRLLAAINRGVVYALAAASVAEIARLNILGATLAAMVRAVGRLPEEPDHILVDGNRLPVGLSQPASCLIGGDGICLSIAAASILAKVLRDGIMERLARLYPHYGFDRHFGYGTRQHRSAIQTNGLTPHHRRLFCRNLLGGE